MLITAERALLALAGIATGIAGKAVYDRARDSSYGDLDDEMEEIYLEKGAGGLARWLKREGHAEDRDEALEMVEDFQADNEDVVRKYDRRKARRKAREDRREEGAHPN